MTDPIQLIPTKSDHDIANQLREEAILAAKPLTDLMDKATSAGFRITIGLGVDGFGRSVVNNLEISKVFKP